MQRLFIYGTLGPGGPNEHMMTSIGGEWHGASTRGRLVKQGRGGATMGFPGLIPDDDGDPVQGNMFTSENLDENWRALDEFEGEGYERALAAVTLDDGSRIQAYVYALRAGRSA